MVQRHGLPTLRVDKIIPEGNAFIIMGSVSRWQWVGENYCAYLYVNQEKLIEGKFRDVNEVNRSVMFVTTGFAPNFMKVDETYPFFDGYWGQRAVLVFDNTLSWQETAFEPRDAVTHNVDGTTELVRGGWDHEHCDICWATIDLQENTVYMKNNDHAIVCLGCFENYILKKSIEFIPDSEINSQ